jgi:hypothetical protein
MDVSKARIAVALAEGGGAEARFFGEIEANEAAVKRLVRGFRAKTPNCGLSTRRGRPAMASIG